MTASGVQPKIGSGRRIIERPRLIKLLDETDARTILLLAPAGYGKTTLARQWLKGMSRCITLSLTPSDRDVIWLAEEIARELEPLDAAATRLVREHVLARPSHDKAPATLAQAIAKALTLARVQWLFLDNYEAATDSIESEQLVSHVGRHPDVHLLVASRVRPGWASSRQAIYGHICEVAREELAMTPDEVASIVGRRSSAARIAAQAHGWAAVVGLAATIGSELQLPSRLPERLHRYLAEELLARVPTDLRDTLFSLALLGTGVNEPPSSRGESLRERLRSMDALGFGTGSDPFELHPLIEDFLLEKLLEEPGAPSRIRQAILLCLDEERWERALMLVGRFDVHDLMDTALRAAFKPLVRTGRLTPLAALAAKAGTEEDLPPPSVDVVHAELALCNGDLDLAQHLAERAETRLSTDDALASRSAAIRAQCLHLKAELDESYAAFELAYARAQDDRDRAEALNGIAFTTVFNEQPNAPEVLDAMYQLRNQSVVAFLRYSMAAMNYRLMGGPGLKSPLPTDAILDACNRCNDPRVRSATTYSVAYSLAATADYALAERWLELFFEDARRFDLEFTIPLGNWALARIALGKRRFAEADRALQAVEEEAARTHEHRHKVSAATLRGRLLLQTGNIDAAVAVTSLRPEPPLFPSWRGELLATRALALAISGSCEQAREVVNEVFGTTISHDARMLAHVAAVITDPSDERERRSLIDAATKLNIWDPVLCGVRAFPALSDALCQATETRPFMESLYERTQEWSLARRAGFRLRTAGAPHDLLTPRELEVLELIARGHKNREISRALFISDSTTKVHVRHILEKLGVRSRAEAVGRYQGSLPDSPTRAQPRARELRGQKRTDPA